MAQSSNRLRGDNQEIVHRLKEEVVKLESQLQRLLNDDTPHRFSLMKTYRNMIDSRRELLDKMM